MVTVSEGTNLALLARQVLAEFLEIVLQRTARMLSALQLAVQPQHTGLLLEEFFPLALWDREQEWSEPQAPWERPLLTSPPLRNPTCSSLTLSCSALEPSGMGPSRARVASKPWMTLSASWICFSRPRAALALRWVRKQVSQLSHTLQCPPDGLSLALTSPHRGGTGSAHRCICSSQC